MAMDQYENVAVSAARRSVLAGGASNESGTYVKFTPVGAEMFAKADGNVKSLVMKNPVAQPREQYHWGTPL
jgi:hypothetical protein